MFYEIINDESSASLFKSSTKFFEKCTAEVPLKDFVIIVKKLYFCKRLNY